MEAVTWLAIDIAVNAALREHGRIGIFCCYDDAEYIRCELPLVANRRFIDFEAKHGWQGNVLDSVAVHDLREYSSENALRSITSAMESEQLMATVVESIRLVNPKTKKIDAELIGTLDTIASKTHCCVLIVPFGAYQAYLEVAEPAKRDLDLLEMEAVSFLKQRVSVWISMTHAWITSGFLYPPDLFYEPKFHGEKIRREVRKVSQGVFDIDFGGRALGRVLSSQAMSSAILLSTEAKSEDPTEEPSREVVVFHDLPSTPAPITAAQPSENVPATD
jgi:hypothetical protein